MSSIITPRSPTIHLLTQTPPDSPTKTNSSSPSSYFPVKGTDPRMVSIYSRLSKSLEILETKTIVNPPSAMLTPHILDLKKAPKADQPSLPSSLLYKPLSSIFNIEVPESVPPLKWNKRLLPLASIWDELDLSKRAKKRSIL